ncbi:MAG: hypothetical protein ACYC5A_09500 [Thermoleophilia bacterium]
MRKRAAVLLAAATLALGAPACGSDGQSDDQQGQDNGIAAPVQALPKAEDAARQTEERGQEQQDEINRGLDQLP